MDSKDMQSQIQHQAELMVEKMKEKISNSNTSAALNELRVKLLGKKGEITEMMKIMKDLSPEERPEFGKRVNILRASISDALESRAAELNNAEQSERLRCLIFQRSTLRGICRTPSI